MLLKLPCYKSVTNLIPLRKSALRKSFLLFYANLVNGKYENHRKYERCCYCNTVELNYKVTHYNSILVIIFIISSFLLRLNY